jgi:hypothetical protein
VRNKSFLLIGALLVGLNAQPAKPAVHAAAARYVSTTGADVGDCSNPSMPCQSIQYAINQAASGDHILVAAGTYYYNPSANPCSFLLTPAVVCFVDKQFTILGGYAPGNWGIRNPQVYQTIIDGQNAYRGVAAIGYHVPDQSHIHMEGFIIQNCRAQGPTYLSPTTPAE